MPICRARLDCTLRRGRQGRSAAAAGDPGRAPGGTASHPRPGAATCGGMPVEAAAGFATIGNRGAVARDFQPRTARADRAYPPQSAGMRTVFVDIDSQLDFLFPSGALYRSEEHT